MMAKAFYSLERLLQTLWVGGLWCVGYLVAPTLFHMLDDRRLAGELAGQMFSSLNIIGFVCGALLVAIALVKGGRNKTRRVVVLGLMVLLVTVSATVLQPAMQALKAGGLVDGSTEAARFGQLHGISSGLFLILSLLGAYLVLIPGAHPPAAKRGAEAS